MTRNIILLTIVSLSTTGFLQTGSVTYNSQEKFTTDISKGNAGTGKNNLFTALQLLSSRIYPFSGFEYSKI